mgnify:CR=1 FL=1
MLFIRPNQNCYSAFNPSLGLSHGAGEPSHSHADAFHGHGGSPKRAVEQVRSWNQEDLDVPQAGGGWIGSAFAHGRDDRPRQEIQQQTSGDAPAHCRCSPITYILILLEAP